MQQRTSRLHLRFPARTNLHFKPVPPFNQLLCMPSQPLLDFSSKISDWATQSYLWLYAGPWGNFIKLLCILRWETRWLTNYSIGGPNSFPHAAKESRFDPVRKAATHASPDRKATNRASTSSPPIRFLSPCVPYMVIPPPFVTVKVGAAKTNKRLFWEGKKIKAWFYSPISLSDLLSISVSVSVSAELERLERHEFCPDFAPHSVMVRSGDAGSWFSVATGPRE